MASTTNYAWTTPDNSGLVKNGAQDIRTLGSAVDTSLWNVGFGQAGKNKIINGDFNINQRSFTSSTTDGAYGFDRWLMEASGGATYSAQTFTVGSAPVAGYESKNFARIATTGQSGAGVYTLLEQKIENVRTFAGQTATVSFWAKAASAGAKIGMELSQSFGAGGSTQVNTQLGAVTLTTSWARYSLSVAVPSISGKTIGTADSLTLGLWTSAGTTFATRASSIGIQTATIDVWGVQVEAGSYATPFQTATGTIQGELAACERYYWRTTSEGSFGALTPVAGSFSTSEVDAMLQLPVSMRVKPTSIDYLNVKHSIWSGTEYAISVLSLSSSNSTPDIAYLYGTVTSGPAQNSTGFWRGASGAYIGVSAEL